ncbi:MAG: methyltransferase domain-containing protein [Gammaproteobacteria bacterium]|nr:methyltransferase domain-containing protein [Gammaproteobacteria bacterium]
MPKKSLDPHHGMRISSVTNKEIMSYIRDGDYQHPGEEEAIELLFQKINKSPELLILDVGCGYGGTAAYIHDKQWGQVVGIDINEDVLNIAKNKHKTPIFIHADVNGVEQAIENEFKRKINFDIIYLFNSFFLFHDHQLALQKLAAVAKKNTKLLIFDYIDYGQYANKAYIENEKKLLPNTIISDEVITTFNESGWTVESLQNIDDLYIKWYTELVQKIDSAKAEIVEQYGNDVFNNFLARYQHILTVLQNKLLGGVIIVAVPTA